MLDRERESREPSPTTAVVDSQSMKAPAAKQRGFDAGKRVVGHKRHIAVDTDGRLLMVNLITADISDSAGAQSIVAASANAGPGSNICSSTGPMIAPDSWTPPPIATSSSRSSADRPGAKLQGVAKAVGRRANLRLADPVEAPRSRLRTATRRLRSHDPRRPRKPHATPHRPSVSIIKQMG